MTVSRSRSTLSEVAGDLARPAPLVAAAVLAVNDHVLKASALAGPVTGKLSDLAGLFVAPIAAVCVARGLARLATGRVPRRDGALAAACVIAVAAGFALLKSWPAFHAVVDRVWGSHVLDRSDLWCLPTTLLAWVWLGDREARAARAADAQGPGRFRSAVALGGVLVICAATPAPPPVPPPQVPMWSIASKPLALACGTADVWVAKSGKTGLGITVRIAGTPAPDGTRAPCDAKVGATLRFPDGAVPGKLVVARRGSELQPHERQRDPEAAADEALRDASYHYIAFELDNQARWNRGERTATVELSIDAGGTLQQWSLPATQGYREFPPRRR